MLLRISHVNSYVGVGSNKRKTTLWKTFYTKVTTVGKKKLSAVPCPVCKGSVEDITVEEESITEAKRVPVLIPAKCKNGHQVVLFVDRQFTVRDVEAAGQVVEESSDDAEGSVDKALKWMDGF